MRRRQWITISLVGVAMLAAAAPAGATITVEQWLARYDALLVRDRITPVSKDDPEVQALFLEEAGSALKALRAAYEDDIAHGRKPAACLPPRGDPKVMIDNRQIVDLLRAVPVADRGETVEQAFIAYARVSFPCPATSAPGAGASGGDAKHE